MCLFYLFSAYYIIYKTTNKPNIHYSIFKLYTFLQPFANSSIINR